MNERIRIRARMLATRAAVRAFAAGGDPLSLAFARSPEQPPYPLYERVRARGEVSRSPLGAYVTASHEVADMILRDRRFGARGPEDPGRDRIDLAGRGAAEFAHPIDDSLMGQDPPEHTRLRRAIGPWFTPRAVAGRAEAVEARVAELLDGLDGVDGFDLVDDFAVRLTVDTVCGLLGVPRAEAGQRFTRWGRDMVECLDGVWSLAQRRRLDRTMAEMDAFFSAQIALRVSAGPDAAADDVLGGLARGLTENSDAAEQVHREVVATAGLLLTAGFETTVNLIGNAAARLLRDDALRAWYLANPERTPDLVEESLRLDPAVQIALRFAHEPVQVHGVRLPRGAMIIVMLGGANRDPAVFRDPDRFDPDRLNSRDHLSFSAGVHYCAGAGLARIVAAAALRGLFTRYPDLRSSGPARYRTTRNIHGVLHLPVRGRAAAYR